jgi:hypothetical protein
LCGDQDEVFTKSDHIWQLMSVGLN